MHEVRRKNMCPFTQKEITLFVQSCWISTMAVRNCFGESQLPIQFSSRMQQQPPSCPPRIKGRPSRQKRRNLHSNRLSQLLEFGALLSQKGAPIWIKIKINIPSLPM